MNSLNDQADYGFYNKVHSQLADRGMKVKERIDEERSHVRLYNFLDKLPEDLQDKKDIKDIL